MTIDELRKSNEYLAIKSYLDETDHDMTKEDVRKMLSIATVDFQDMCPYTDSWISHGYDSYADWIRVNKDFLDYLDELSDLIDRAIKKYDTQYNEKFEVDENAIWES